MLHVITLKIVYQLRKQSFLTWILFKGRSTSGHLVMAALSTIAIWMATPRPCGPLGKVFNGLLQTLTKLSVLASIRRWTMAKWRYMTSRAHQSSRRHLVRDASERDRARESPPPICTAIAQWNIQVRDILFNDSPLFYTVFKVRRPPPQKLPEW